MTKKTTLEIIAGLLALLFAYAAASKFLDIHLFRKQLIRAPYLKTFAGFLAVALPIAELGIVALLYWPKTKLIGLWVSFAAMLVFTIYIGLMLATHQHLPCTCGGLIQKLSWPQHLVFNILFSLIAGAGIILYNKQESGYEDSNYNLSIS